MLNIIKSEKLNKGQGKDPVDQGWLNEVYRWEKFDIGPQFNALALLAQEQKNDLMDFIAQQKNSMLNENENIYSYIQNASIIHLAGTGRKWKYMKNNCKEPILTICNKWKYYIKKIPWTFDFDFDLDRI